MADLEDIFSSFEAALAKRPAREKIERRCDFSGYTDTDLLQMPASTITAEKRSAALKGRAYITGDICSSDIAVVRIPDAERAITDFKPHLDWSGANPARAPRVGKYKINRNLANRGIAPRIAEPAPPAQTKTGVFSATDADTPLAPIERAILRGGQCIQIVKKAGGDYAALATLLGKIWGDSSLFAPTEELDLLGDVSLPRVLARDGKKRFEIYRNIGFTSLVSAGGSTANPRAYGDSSVINWQKRVELSKLFLHFAQALEGGPLTVGSEFHITTRIPAYTVPHVIWEDLAVDVDPDLYPMGVDLAVYTQRAISFATQGMHAALVAVSDFIRARAGQLGDDLLNAIVTVAGHYDKLTYLEEMPKHLAPKVHRPELTYAVNEVETKFDAVAYKAHDVRTAVLEILADNAQSSQEAANAVATLNAALQVADQPIPGDYRGFVNRVLAEVPYLYTCAKVVADRPLTYENRHKKAVWSSLAKREIPRSLLEDRDAYDATLIARATIHTLFKDPTSQARRKLKHINGILRETLDAGIRRKRTLLASSDGGVLAAVHAEIHVTNRRFYRERYRKPARVWKIYADHCIDPVAKARAEITAAWWYARSDAAHCTVLAEDNGTLTAKMPAKRLKSVLAVYLSHMKKFVAQQIEELTSKPDVWGYVRSIVDPLTTAKGCTYTVDSLKTHFDSYCEAQARDHLPTEVVAANLLVAPVAGTHDASEFLNIADKDHIKFKDSVDNMVSTWANLSGASAYIDEDDIDSMIKWMEECLGEFVDRVEWYIETHSQDLDEDRAQELFDEWFERWENRKEEVGDARRGEII